MNGLLLVDKDTGMTSHDVVDSLRKILGTKAIGHAGTLDPLATGVLVCLVGEATKLSQFVMAQDKSYRVGVRLGVQTDSGDITGAIMQEKEASHLSLEEIQAGAVGLTGHLDLPVPKYSAIKVEGKKLYEYARNNDAVEVPVKRMVVHKVTFESFENGVVWVQIDCEKGTYVRSWAEKLGEILGVGATVISLRRTLSGSFKDVQCLTLAQLKEKKLEGSVPLIPMHEALCEWPALKLLGRDMQLLRNGQIPNAISLQLGVAAIKEGVRFLDDQGKLLALGTANGRGGVKLARVFAAV